MSDVTKTYALWRRLRRLPRPIGTRVFSVAAALMAPYFRTVLPHVRVLEPGRCIVTAPKWWGVQNHIGTFHAIAACNLAEAAMGMLMEATVPTSHRWIPKAMHTQYLSKAKTGLTAHAELAEPIDFADITEGTEVVVAIRILNKDNEEVVHCDITTWVTPA